MSFIYFIRVRQKLSLKKNLAKMFPNKIVLFTNIKKPKAIICMIL